MKIPVSGVDKNSEIREHSDCAWSEVAEIGTVAQQMAGAALSMYGEAKQALKEAMQMRAGLNLQLEVLTRPTGQNSKPPLPPMDKCLVVSDENRAALTELLYWAISTTRADMGNIQLFNSSLGVLQIAAQLGFDRQFLEFFNSVHDGQAACGTALKTAERVIVEDITQSPIFVGTPGLEVMLDARARAVQSTPLVGPSGHLLGILSTHYHVPRRPTHRDIRMLDLLSRRTARFIEREMISSLARGVAR